MKFSNESSLPQQKIVSLKDSAQEELHNAHVNRYELEAEYQKVLNGRIFLLTN
jgi:hypothetical protein